MNLPLLLLFFPILHFGIALVLLGGIFRRYRRREDEPFISIVVPVRNEEENLSNLLESLLELDYPAEAMEIVIVNDESDDRTKEIALTFAARFRCHYRVIDADHSLETNLTAKTLPLTQGIDIARGEFILMTDGDCVVPKTWARGMVSYFTKGVGVVCGVTLPKLSQSSRSFSSLFEAVDWSFLLGVCAGFASLGKPLALIGNNYAVRRSTYEELGTFRRMEFNSIDDIAMQRAVDRSRSWSIAFPVDRSTVIRTLPIGNVADQARQRRRWTKGKDIMDRMGQAILGFAVITHLTWPLWILIWGLSGAAGAAFVALGDYIVIAATLLKIRERKPLLLTLLYPFYSFYYSWLLVFYLMSGKTVEWKARPFSG